MLLSPGGNGSDKGSENHSAEDFVRGMSRKREPRPCNQRDQQQNSHAPRKGKLTQQDSGKHRERDVVRKLDPAIQNSQEPQQNRYRGTTSQHKATAFHQSKTPHQQTEEQKCGTVKRRPISRIRSIDRLPTSRPPSAPHENPERYDQYDRRKGNQAQRSAEAVPLRAGHPNEQRNE